VGPAAVQLQSCAVVWASTAPKEVWWHPLSGHCKVGVCLSPVALAARQCRGMLDCQKSACY